MLANKALLAVLNISQWTGRRYDKRATGAVEDTFNTDRTAGNYTKKLLPGAKELENVQRIAGSIRIFFYEQSLPWYSDGSRIIAAQNYLDFTSQFRQKKGEFDYAVSQFLQEYPRLKEEARVKLGELFRDSEYPSVGYLARLFSCEISFMPVPDVSDFRVQVLDSEKEAFLAKMHEVETQAMKECWDRLYTVVSKAAGRIADKDAILRDSLVENINEICALLPKLNISNDANLESMRQAVEKTVAGINVDDCRAKPDARQEAAKTLNDITAKMSAFMGMVAPTYNQNNAA